MSNEVVKTESSVPAQMSPDLYGMDLSMMLLPTLAIRQNSFKADYMKKVTPGNALMRPTNDIICGVEKKARFVVLNTKPMYRIKRDKKFTVGWEPYIEGKPWNFTNAAGDLLSRHATVVAHVMFEEAISAQTRMVEDLKAGKPVDPADFVLPCRVNFDGQSLNAGKVLATHCQMSKMANSQSPAAIVFELFTKEMENDKGHWFAYEVVKASKDKFLDKVKLDACNHWVALLANMDTRSHDDDDSLDTSTETATTTDVPKGRSF